MGATTEKKNRLTFTHTAATSWEPPLCWSSPYFWLTPPNLFSIKEDLALTTESRPPQSMGAGCKSIPRSMSTARKISVLTSKKHRTKVAGGFPSLSLTEKNFPLFRLGDIPFGVEGLLLVLCLGVTHVVLRIKPRPPICKTFVQIC